MEERERVSSCRVRVYSRGADAPHVCAVGREERERGGRSYTTFLESIKIKSHPRAASTSTQSTSDCGRRSSSRSSADRASLGSMCTPLFMLP